MQDGRIPVRSTPPIEQKTLTPQDPGHIMPNGNGGGAKSPILQGEDERHIRDHPRHQTPKGLAQNTTPPVADVGLPLSLAHRVPHAQSKLARTPQKQQPHQISLNTKTGAEDEVELPTFPQGYAMVRHLRPLRLRLRRILRPEGEEERARKPIFLLRGFLCGWKVPLSINNASLLSILSE